MCKLYIYETSAGAFYIAEHNGHFHPMFRDESFGSYATAQQAVADLVGGHTFSLPADIDPAELGVPAELEDWVKIPPEV